MKIRPLTLLVTLLPLASQGASVIVNPGFEDPGTAFGFFADTTVPGWSTTATDGLIELWPSGFLGVASHSGVQHAELNAAQDSALFQDVTIDIEGLVDFSFAHRARVGVDTMRMDITYLGPDGVFGGGDDVAVVNDYQVSTDTSDWRVYSEEDVFTSIAGGNYRFSYGSVSTGSGDATVGNFLDSVSFGVDAGVPSLPIEAIPEPSGVLSLGALLGFGLLFRTRR